MSDDTLSNNGHTIYVVGYWSSIIAAILAIAFTILAFVFPVAEWQGIEAYKASFQFNQMYNHIPVLLLTPVMVILMTCIHFFAPNNKKFFGMLGLAFSIVYAVIISINYYIQLFVVRLNLINGDLNGLSLWALPNLHSIFFAFESLGYCFLGLATFFAAVVFTGGKLENWIKVLFITNGVFGISGAIISLFDKPLIIFAALGLWCIVFPLSTILLANLFHRRIKLEFGK